MISCDRYALLWQKCNENLFPIRDYCAGNFRAPQAFSLKPNRSRFSETCANALVLVLSIPGKSSDTKQNVSTLEKILGLIFRRRTALLISSRVQQKSISTKSDAESNAKLIIFRSVLADPKIRTSGNVAQPLSGDTTATTQFLAQTSIYTRS